MQQEAKDWDLQDETDEFVFKYVESKLFFLLLIIFILYLIGIFQLSYIDRKKLMLIN